MRWSLHALLALAITSPTVAAAQAVPIVYSRCARTDAPREITADVTIGGATRSASRTLTGWDVYDRLPDVTHFLGGFNAPCDLVYRDAAGTERVLYDCASTSTVEASCAAMDPMVSFDGATVAFSVFRGPLSAITTTINAQVLDPDADNAVVGRFDTGGHVIATESAQIHLVDVATGELTALPFVDGEIDAGPAFLPDGRLMFTSTREGNQSTIVFRTGGNGRRGARLFTMDLDGRNVDLASPDALGVEEHPFVLSDGRVVFSSWQVGMGLPFRHTNGSTGGFTTLDNLFHLFTRDPDGSHVFAFYGQHAGDHTHVTSLGHDHKAAHFITQTGDGRVWFVDYYRGNNNGLGMIVGVMPEPEGQEGFGPDEMPRRGDLYAPRDAMTFATWSTSNDSMARPYDGTEPLAHPAYADPMPFFGKVGHPAAADDGLVLVWGKGPCSTVASNGIFRALDREAPPLTSGSGQGTAVNVVSSLGIDTPGCDAGIYRSTRVPSESPLDLELLVDSREWHEIQPRAVLPYAEIHGTPQPPARPRSDLADAHHSLEVGAPFGLLGAASILDRETHPLGGIHFGGEHQFHNQGTDTIDYTGDELCGVRILGAMPNMGRNAHDEIANAAGERLAILGEISVRNLDPSGAPRLDPSGNPDTSFLVRFPADVPYFMQGIDCEGRTLNTDQSWQSLRPGEVKTCGGCHVHSRESRVSFAETWAATDGYAVRRLGEGRVPLLGAEPREVEGYGLQIDLQRDVMPIFERRCVSCHGGDTPEAGLALDVPGTEAGSTWHCLVRDGAQSCVPEALRWRASDGRTALRRPQLTRYLRAFNSRGSLLYWKAANARTDNRTDAQFDDSSPDIDRDIDFGADHPTDITPEELGILSRWIDLGAPGGPMELRDTQRPTLTLAATASGDAVTHLHVGTVDLGSGVAPETLELCVLDEAGACAVTLPATAEMHGVLTIALETPLSDPEVEVQARVEDAAGNASVLRRTVRYLLDAPPPPPPRPMVDGAIASPDGGTSPPETVDGSCGCRAAGSDGGRPLALLAALIGLVAWRRRRSA